MTLDRCLPQALLKTNRRGTTHRILILFFLLCVSVLLITKGHVPVLAGVYTISFLSVMALFGIGNILLKVKRARLPRPDRAAWPVPLLGIGAVVVGLIGNVVMSPDNFRVFLQYFIPAVLIIVVMLERIAILKGLLFITHSVRASMGLPLHPFSKSLQASIDRILDMQIVFFARGHSVAHLNHVMQYVLENEHTNRVKVVTVVKSPDQVSQRLRQDIEVLDRAYPEIDIEFVIVEGTFSPSLIRQLSREWKIPINYMFIGSPEGRLIYDLADLGGVRLII